MRVVTLLQAENKEVLKSKYSLLELKEVLQNKGKLSAQSSVLQATEPASEKDLKAKAEKLKEVVDFFVVNGIEGEINGIGLDNLFGENE